MNKDFEKAYKELARVEAPDLWDRIENGLNEKSTPVKKKSSFVVFLRRYSALAAAVLCVVILVPAMILMKHSGSKSFSEKAMSAEDFNTAVTEACETTEEAAPEEPVEEYTETAEEKSVEGYAGAAADLAAGEGAQTGAAMAEAETAEDTAEISNFMAQKELMEEKKESAAEETEKDSRSEAADRKFTNVTVTIEETKEQITEGDINEMGTICTGIVKNDPSGVLAEGEEIHIFIPVVSSVALFKGETYELNLSYMEEKDVYTVSFGIP